MSALALTLALFAQAPQQAIGDGWIAEIREARADLREHREAIRESAAEGAAARTLIERIGKRWDERLDRWEQRAEASDGPVSKFLDRIGNGLLLICGTIVLVGVPFGVGYLIRSVRAKA